VDLIFKNFGQIIIGVLGQSNINILIFKLIILIAPAPSIDSGGTYDIGY